MHQHGGVWQDTNEILDFSININLAGCSERVREAASLGVLYSDRYPDTECKKLREEIAKWENVPMQNVICGNGAADLKLSTPRRKVVLCFWLPKRSCGPKSASGAWS